MADLEEISINSSMVSLAEKDALGRIAKSLLEKIAHTGLSFSDVTPKLTFEVSVPLSDGKEAKGSGATYEAAVIDAVKGAAYEKKGHSVSIVGNIEVPYFLEQVRGKGLSANAALEGLVQATRTAKDKYGTRIVADKPESAKYIVQLTSADYSSSNTGIPDSIGKKALLGRGDTHESGPAENIFEIAFGLATAAKNKDYKTKDRTIVSTVYEVRQNLKVYGAQAVASAAKPAAPYVAPAQPAAPAKPAYVPPPAAATQPPPAAKPAKPTYHPKPTAPAAPIAATAAVAAPSYASARTRGRGSTAGSSPGYAPSPMKLA